MNSRYNVENRWKFKIFLSIIRVREARSHRTHIPTELLQTKILTYSTAQLFVPPP